MRFLCPILLIAAGATLVVSGFAYDLYFAGIPYPDPTAEMQERWLFHKGISERVIHAGVIILGVGCALKGAQWIYGFLKGRQAD